MHAWVRMTALQAMHCIDNQLSDAMHPHGPTSAVRQTPKAPLPTSSPRMYLSSTLPSTRPQKMSRSRCPGLELSLLVLALPFGDPNGLHPLLPVSSVLELMRLRNEDRDALSFLVKETLLNDDDAVPRPGLGGVAAPTGGAGLLAL